MTLLTAEASTRRRYLPTLVLSLVAGFAIAAVAWNGGPTTRHAVTTRSIMLSTHCGVEGAVVDGTRYVADPPLYREPGRGNPPDGWDNPSQRGVMTVYSDGTAVFERPDGLEVTFVKDARRERELQPCF